jgi:hypothetical protein
VATRIITVAKSASTSISPPARVAGRQKYRKTIAPTETMGAVCDILAAIRSITAAIAAKVKTRSHLFGRSEKTKTGKQYKNVILLKPCKSEHIIILKTRNTISQGILAITP